MSVIAIILQIVLLLISVISIIAVVYFQRRIRSYKENELKLQNEIDNSKKKLLQQAFEQVSVELNPHLFKNTLNAIQSYAFKTHVALDRLGKLLDFILYDSKNGLISVQEEIEFVKNFIELNKLRLNPLFEISIKIELDEKDTFIRKPLLVPLVTSHLIENAFKHGDLNSKDGYIDILISFKEGIFYCQVSNKINFSPVLDNKGGFGKMNLQKRLELAYNSKYELIYNVEEDIYRASLKIDLNG